MHPAKTQAPLTGPQIRVAIVLNRQTTPKDHVSLRLCTRRNAYRRRYCRPPAAVGSDGLAVPYFIYLLDFIHKEYRRRTEDAATTLHGAEWSPNRRSILNSVCGWEGEAGKVSAGEVRGSSCSVLREEGFKQADVAQDQI